MPLVPPAHAGAPFHRTVHLLVHCRVHLFPLLQDLLTLDNHLPHTARSWHRTPELYAWDMSLGGWLQDQLFERRIVLVTGRLNEDAAARAAAALLALDARGDQPIELHLDSPDGALGAALVA